jgi:hypothetical protein
LRSGALPCPEPTSGATAEGDLHTIWMAESRADAEKAMQTFEAKYGAKYPKAVACLTKDREALLAFYDFPAEHWQHIRTANPIESVFATVRHRTVRTKGCLWSLMPEGEGSYVSENNKLISLDFFAIGLFLMKISAAKTL